MMLLMSSFLQHCALGMIILIIYRAIHARNWRNPLATFFVATPKNTVSRVDCLLLKKIIIITFLVFTKALVLWGFFKKIKTCNSSITRPNRKSKLFSIKFVDPCPYHSPPHLNSVLLPPWLPHPWLPLATAVVLLMMHIAYGCHWQQIKTWR